MHRTTSARFHPDLTFLGLGLFLKLSFMRYVITRFIYLESYTLASNDERVLPLQLSETGSS
jgi:hypothetical protein